MRHAAAGPNLVPDRVAQAEAVVARAERRQPGGYLAAAPLGEILAALGNGGGEILQQ